MRVVQATSMWVELAVDEGEHAGVWRVGYSPILQAHEEGMAEWFVQHFRPRGDERELVIDETWKFSVIDYESAIAAKVSAFEKLRTYLGEEAVSMTVLAMKERSDAEVAKYPHLFGRKRRGFWQRLLRLPP